MFRFNKKHVQAFTLIELLIVMSIIMMLAAISVPVYNKVRSIGYLRSCQENLRGIGRALHLYRSENGGWLPYTSDNGIEQTAQNGKAVRWKYELSFYMGNHTQQEKRTKSYPLNPAFFDPVKGRGNGNYMLSAKHFGTRMQVQVPSPSGGLTWIDYSITEERQFIAGQSSLPDGFMKYEHWREPSRAAVIGPSVDPKMQRGVGRAGNVVNIEYRHSGKANILFLDGHVQVYAEGEEKLFEFFDRKELWRDRVRQVD